jgi:spermidine/putrescine transport system substrate-binding protein
MVLSACSRNEGPTAGAENSDERSEAPPTKLTLVAWEEYFAPEAIASFEKKFGVAVDYQTFGEVEELEARLKSQPESVDVAVVDSYNLNKFRKLRLLYPLDRKRLPNFRNIAATYLDRGWDPKNEFSVPYMWGTTLVAYRTDKISDPAPSWELLWDERYRGRVMMLDDSFDPLATAMLMLGKTIETRSGDDFEAATNRLVSQIRRVGVRYGSDNDVKERLASGEVWAAMCYSGDAAVVAEETGKVDYFIPREGAPQWLDSFAVGRDSRLTDLAHAFIDHMLEREIAAMNSNAVRYATPNAAAEPLLDEDLRNDPRIYPPADILARCTFLPYLDAEREALVSRHWHTVKRAYLEAQSSVLSLAAPDQQ